MRLFASIEPSPQALTHLAAALAAVRPLAVGAGTDRPALRWVDPEQWHVTLAFYGEVPDGAAPALAEALAGRVGALPPPRLRLRGAGSFARRSLWIGVAGESEADAGRLAGLTRASVAAGADVGVGPQDRERNRGHLTVARVVARRGRPGAGPVAPELSGVVGALAVYAGPVFTARAVTLVRSRLGAGRGGGPLYEVVASITPRG